MPPCVIIIFRCVALKYVTATNSAAMCVYKMLPELLCPSYSACHIADFCVVAAVLLGCKQVLTGWLSYGCFPLTYCKCSLFLLFCHSLLPLRPFFLSSLLSSSLLFFRAGLQMSGFPKVSSLPLYDCTWLLLPVGVIVVVVVLIEKLS